MVNIIEKNNFRQLVSELTLEERQELLKKLKSHFAMTGIILYTEDTKAVSVKDDDAAYSSLSVFRRFWYFIIGLIKSKSSRKIFEERQITALGKKIEKKFPHMYNYKKEMLMPLFYKQLQKLKGAAQFFHSALDASVNRNGSAFFAFLASLEMADIHRMLEEETDPAVVAGKHPDVTEKELRQMAFRVMEEILEQISNEQRGAMYTNARTLFCLKALSSFSYDRLIGAFNYNSEMKGEACYAFAVREQLASLYNILISLRNVPNVALLQSLFVFLLQKRAGNSVFDFDKEINSLLMQAEEFLTVIQEFNKQVPLDLIIYCSSRGEPPLLKEISGGEDWFVNYRDFWKQQIESLHANFIKEHRQKKLMNSFSVFFKGNSIEPLENTQSPSNIEGIPLKGSLTLSFLSAFYSFIFMPDMNWFLQIIFTDGKFKQEDNQVEFAWSFNCLLKLKNEITKFEHEISPTGIYGERYLQLYNDRFTSSATNRNLRQIIDKVQENANSIIEQAREACQKMINILNGMLGQNPIGKYHTLVNLANIYGTKNHFVSFASEIAQQFAMTLRLLDEIDVMETGR